MECYTWMGEVMLVSNKTLRQAAISIASIYTLSTCATVQSTRLGYSGSDLEEGIGYCLPMGKVTIEIHRNTVTASNSPASGKLGIQTMKVAATEGLPESFVSTLAQAGPEPLVDLTGVIPGIDEARPVGPMIPQDTGPINGQSGVQASLQGFRPYRISYKSTTYVPDASKRFAMRYRGNGMMADEIKVTLTKESLLDNVSVTTDDKTAEIAKKVIEIGKNLFRLSQGGGIRSQAAQSEELIFTGSFDPTSPTELSKFNKILSKIDGGPYRVELMNLSSSDAKAVNSTYEPAAPTSGRFNGVAFRPALAYGLVLYQGAKAQEVATVMLPNEAEILYMPLTRSAFVKKVQSLDFNEGMLVEANINKPSEVLGFIEIPLEITRAVLALPGEVAADNIAALQRRTDGNAALVKAIQADGVTKRSIMDDRILTQKKEIEAAESQSAYDAKFPSEKKP